MYRLNHRFSTFPYIQHFPLVHHHSTMYWQSLDIKESHLSRLWRFLHPAPSFFRPGLSDSRSNGVGFTRHGIKLVMALEV
jgi:hypothetical protein